MPTAQSNEWNIAVWSCFGYVCNLWHCCHLRNGLGNFWNIPDTLYPGGILRPRWPYVKFLSWFPLPCFIVFSIGSNNNIKLKPQDFIVKSIKGIMLTSPFHWPHFLLVPWQEWASVPKWQPGPSCLLRQEGNSVICIFHTYFIYFFPCSTYWLFDIGLSSYNM